MATRSGIPKFKHRIRVVGVVVVIVVVIVVVVVCFVVERVVGGNVGLYRAISRPIVVPKIAHSKKARSAKPIIRHHNGNFTLLHGYQNF